MTPLRTTDQRSHLTLLSTVEADRLPRASYAPKTAEAHVALVPDRVATDSRQEASAAVVHASRRLIHQMQKPLRASATPVNIANSSHWNIQYRLAGW